MALPFYEPKTIVDNIIAAYDHVNTLLLRQVIQFLKSIRRKIIITIQKTYIFTTSLQKAISTGKCKSFILLVYDSNTMVILCIFLTYLQTLVRRAIIDNDDLKVLKRLSEYRTDTLPNILLLIIYRNNYTNDRSIHVFYLICENISILFIG